MKKLPLITKINGLLHDIKETTLIVVRLLKSQVKLTIAMWKCQRQAKKLADSMVNNVMNGDYNKLLSELSFLGYGSKSTDEVGNIDKNIVMSYFSGYGLLPVQSEGSLLDI